MTLGCAYGDEYNLRSCPYCGFDKCSAEYVDVGVAMAQVTPFGCEACHAYEIGPYDKIERKLTPDEKRTGWYEPDLARLPKSDWIQP